jgi:hypothetical protein
MRSFSSWTLPVALSRHLHIKGPLTIMKACEQAGRGAFCAHVDRTVTPYSNGEPVPSCRPWRRTAPMNMSRSTEPRAWDQPPMKVIFQLGASGHCPADIAESG